MTTETTQARVACTHDPIVRLWVVFEEDRGMGVTARSCHASEEDANTHCGGHKFADPVDVPWSVLESLKPKPASLDRPAAFACTVGGLVGGTIQEDKR